MDVHFPTLTTSLCVCVAASKLEGYSKVPSMMPCLPKKFLTQNTTSSIFCHHLTLIFLILSVSSCFVAYLVGSRSSLIVSNEDPIQDSALLGGTSRLGEGKM